MSRSPSTAASSRGRTAMKGGMSRGGTGFSSSIGRTRSGPAIRAGNFMRGKADEMIKFQEEQAKKLQEQEEEEEEANYYEWMDWVRTSMPSLVAFGRTLSRAPSAEPAAISQTPSAFARLPSSEVKKEEEQLNRDWETACLKVTSWEMAYVLDMNNPLWEDDQIPQRVVRQWEWLCRNLVAESANMKEKTDKEMVTAMATLLGGGVGGEQAHKKAQSYETRGHELYQLEDFKGAVQSFKDASNWYFKSGNRKNSDDCRDWAKRARAREVEEEVDANTAVSLECYCVCERVRVFDFFEEAMIRTAAVRSKWVPKRPSELELVKGDVLTVLGKDEEETENDPDIIWYRGIRQPREGEEGQDGSRPPTGESKVDGRSKTGATDGTGSRNVTAKPKEGLFPTRQFLYDERGRPMHDDDGNRLKSYIVVLNPSPIFVKYSLGNQIKGADADVKDAGEGDGKAEEETVGIGESTRTMDSSEFIAMLRQQRIVPPQGHIPGPVQATADDAMTCFREANRGSEGDEDTAQCDFEEFIVAMRLMRNLLGFSADRTEVERATPGFWACAYAERLLGQALIDLNKAYKLMVSVDEEWAKALKNRCKIKAMQFGAFQEKHAKLLTSHIQYEVAYKKYGHARQLYGGETGQAETGFPPEEEALSDLERAFTVNQYKAAMQLLRLTAPNPSSHVGIPSHVGDPTRKAVQVDKAHAIFDEMKDHQAMGMTMRVGAELKLRLGDVRGSLEAAGESLNEYTRIGDAQGTAAAYRLLADAQLVSGMVVESMGSIKSSVQSSADYQDFVNECKAYNELGKAQLWIGDLDLADHHFHKCLELCDVSKDPLVEGQAIAGRGYVSVLLGQHDDGVELLESGALILQQCDDRDGVTRATFEVARIRRMRGEPGWRRMMESAASTLMKTVPSLVAQENKLGVARCNATAWIWRVQARLATELHTRMTQGETLIDTMLQLSWEGLQEGKSVLQGVEAVGDQILRAEVLESIALMRMLGLNPVDKVRETLDEAIKVYERNAGRIGLSRLKTLMASLSIFKKDYRQAAKYLKESHRLIQQCSMEGGEEEAQTMWLWSIANRLSGEGGGGKEEMQRAMYVYSTIGGGRLCSLCSGHCLGACYTCLMCYQRDYCVDCYSECAFTGRSCHPTSSMLRSNTTDTTDVDVPQAHTIGR